MARRSFEQVRVSILYNESLHKIEGGMNYGVDIEKLCRLLEIECKQTLRKSRYNRMGGI